MNGDMLLLRMRLRRASIKLCSVCNFVLIVINVAVFVGLCTYAFDKDEDVFRRGVMLRNERRAFKDMVKTFFAAAKEARVTVR